MAQQTRRVVTGHDANGKAVVLIDGAATNAKLREATGLVSTLLWVTEESPAELSGGADEAAREIGVAPPPRARSSASSTFRRQWISASSTTRPCSARWESEPAKATRATPACTARRASTTPSWSLARSTCCSTIPKYT